MHTVPWCQYTGTADTTGTPCPPDHFDADGNHGATAAVCADPTCLPCAKLNDRATVTAPGVWHFAGRPHDTAKMHAGRCRDCIICTLPKATTRPVSGQFVQSAWYLTDQPWSPPGSVVINGVTVVPGKSRGLVNVLPPTAADTAEVIGQATGSRSSHATVERVTYDRHGGRHVEVLDEADWSADRLEVNARVADVFEAAQEARLRRRMIEAWPALRDALTLT